MSMQPACYGVAVLALLVALYEYRMATGYYLEDLVAQAWLGQSRGISRDAAGILGEQARRVVAFLWPSVQAVGRVRRVPCAA